MITPVTTLLNKLYIFAVVVYFFILSTFIEDGDCLTFVDEKEYDKSLQVETHNGMVQGVRRKMDNGKYIYEYKGIPFAKPPLYHLRFRSPQQHSNWSGVLDARFEAPSCIQTMIRLTDISIFGSEDCLYLNVYSPVSPGENEVFPVLFYIFGGGFIEGNASVYDPEYFVNENVVAVMANYRIGIFGFLSTEDEAAPGNYGLKDQNASLRWIQKNIKNFRGDPNKVTIMGQSAGACSTMYHMISPKSKGLFHGAIAMSGDTLTPWCYQKYPRKVANDIGIHLGISVANSTAFVETLRKLDVDILTYSQITPILVNLAQLYNNGLIFTPVIECNHKDAFITKSSYSLLKEGKFAKVPVIIGITSMEFKLFIQGISLMRPLFLIFDLSPSSIPCRMDIPSSTERSTAGKEIRKRYIKSNSFLTASNEEVMRKYFSDIFYLRPIHKTVELLFNLIPVYFYEFDHTGRAAEDFVKYFNFRMGKDAKAVTGVGHAEDLAYLWKKSKMNEKDKLVSRRSLRLWSNFVKYGNPTPVADQLLQNVTWPPVKSSNSTTYLHIGENLSVLQNYRSGALKFWNELYEKYCQKPFCDY